MSATHTTGFDSQGRYVGQPIDDATALAWARAIFNLMVTLRLPGKQSACLGWLLSRSIFQGHTGIEYWAADLAEAIRSERATTSGASNVGTIVAALASAGLVRYQPGSKLPHQREDQAIPSRVTILDPGLIRPMKRGNPPQTPGGAEVRHAINALRHEKIAFAHAQNVKSVTADLAALRAAGHPAVRSAEAMAWLLGSWADGAGLAHCVRDWPDRLAERGVDLPSDEDLCDSTGRQWGRARCLRAGRSAIRRAVGIMSFPAIHAS